MSKPETIMIDDVKYIRADSVKDKSEHKNTDGLPLVIVRSATASPFFGYLVRHENKQAELLEARRIREWYGAMDLSQMAMEGVKEPDRCKFGIPCHTIVDNVNEVHFCTEIAAKSIQGVKEWKK